MQSITRNTLSIFWQHTKKYRWLIFFLVIFSAIQMSAEIVQPFFYRALINFVSGESGTDSNPINLVLLVSACAFLSNLAWRGVLFVNNRLQAKTKRDLLRTSYNYVISQSMEFFSNSFVGGLVSKINRFDRAYESIVDEVVFGVGRSIIYLAVVFVVLLWNIPVAGLIIGIWMVIHIFFSVLFNNKKFKYDLSVSEQDTLVTGHLADTISNSNTVKSFATENQEKKTFADLSQIQFLRRLKTWEINNWIDGFQGLSMVILEFVIMFFAVRLWQAGTIAVGDFVLLQAYMLNIFHLIWSIGRTISRLYQSVADANEMTQILSSPYDVQDRAGNTALKVSSAKVEFNNVSFFYKNQQAIFKDFNFAIEGSERVALVGPSGGGKSTIVKLLFRFYDINSGTVEIDGQDISKVTQTSLRKQISLVPQDPILFHRSILENIRYAKPEATEQEVIAAAKAAHCHEFIDKLESKYETMVGERGVKLSGGERQRVAIARAILKNAPILVLDEATSSLDSESESLIQDALKTLMHGKTTIVIAHRLSTIMAMDRIVVIEGGKITEQGKHEELLKAQEGKYQKLWHIQAGGFANTAQ